MRTLVAATAGVLVMLVTSASAQQPDSPVSVERVARALQRTPPPLVLTSPPEPAPAPGSRQLGVFTLLPPESEGQFIRVRVPVGEMVMGTVHAVSNARHRRAERNAGERVERALQDFQRQQVARP